jgi:hypothetical protein
MMNFFIFWGPMPLFMIEIHTKYILNQYSQQYCHFFPRKKLYSLAGLEPGSSIVQEGAPRRRDGSLF